MVVGAGKNWISIQPSRAAISHRISSASGDSTAVGTGTRRLRGGGVSATCSG